VNQEANEVYHFMQAIGENPEDYATRLIFADWLDDHDEPELAQFQRDYCSEPAKRKREAERRIRKVADEFARGDYEGLLKGIQEGGFCFSSEGYRYDIDWDELWQDVETVTSQEVLYYAKDLTRFGCSC
jgi:uncharacterized protein (TIGR02996 family)